jgi:hypothetical protein
MAPTKDTMFRSADMSLTQLYIANEIGREVVSALGELGVMDFRDVSGRKDSFPRFQELFRLETNILVLRSSTPRPARSSAPSPKKSGDWTMWKDSLVRISGYRRGTWLTAGRILPLANGEGGDPHTLHLRV